MPSPLIASRVVLNPLTPMKIATTPNRISTPPARNPPISQYPLPFILLHLPTSRYVAQRRGADVPRHRENDACSFPGSRVRRAEKYAGGLPGLQPNRELRPPDADPRIDREAAVGEREHRVEIELRDGRELLP